MANQLKMAEIHSILTLRTRGWSFRRIARELGVHRETVARYVQLAGEAATTPVTFGAPAKPANAPIGPAPPEAANAPTGMEGATEVPAGPTWAALLPPPGRAGPPSGCLPYRAVIEAKLAAGLRRKSRMSPFPVLEEKK